MTPTPEGTRQRKAWETIRRKQAQKQAEAGAVIAKASKAARRSENGRSAESKNQSRKELAQAALQNISN